jgi:hypothetical protein
MTDPARDEERRALERRAFGKDGSGLSEAEAARLTELRRDGAARREPVPEADPASDPESMLPAEPALFPAVLEGASRAVPAASAAATEPGPPVVPVSDRGSPETPGSRPRTPVGRLGADVAAWLATGRWKRPRYLIGGLVALLLVGVLIGVAIPRPPESGLALRSGEAERRDKVAAHADFDPGSVALLARSDHALLWYATQSRGDLVCAIIDVTGAPPQQNCLPRRAIRDRPIDVSS